MQKAKHCFFEEPTRSSVLSLSFGSRELPQDEVPPVDSSGPVGLSGQVDRSCLDTLEQTGSAVMVGHSETSRRLLVTTPTSRPSVLVRRVQSGLGSQSHGPVRLSSLVSRGEGTVHQSE